VKIGNSRPFVFQAAVVACLAGALVVAGCYPGGPESLDDLGLVITQKNPDANFGGMLTYAMEDTVVQLSAPNVTSPEPLDRQYDQTILEEIQTQLADAGFRRVDYENERPDAWVRVGAVQSDVWIYSYNWGYWGGYWSPSYGGGYPSMNAASFTQGTITWEFLDLRGIPDPIPEDPEPVLNWLAGINGALQSSSTTESGIRTGIRQAFTQSPYIEAAPASKSR
jgi:hypothetical protein